MPIKEKVLAVLSYLLILALIPILWRGKSDFVKSHARHGLVLLALWYFLLFIFQIPFLGVILGILWLLACLIFTVWGIVDAVLGKDAKIAGLDQVTRLLFAS